MHNKSHFDEVSDGVRNKLLDNGEKANVVIKWQKLGWLVFVIKSFVKSRNFKWWYWIFTCVLDLLTLARMRNSRNTFSLIILFLGFRIYVEIHVMTITVQKRKVGKKF